MKQGYLYIATGEQYVLEAAKSAASLKRLNQSVHVTLVTDTAVSIKEFDHVIIQEKDPVQGWKEGILYKVKGLQRSPYEKTFFADTDTYFVDDCTELFDVLDHYELLICHAPSDISKVVIDGKELDGYYPYNTGVIVFNRTVNVSKLLIDWLRIYKEKFDVYPHDQTPFMESLLVNSVKVYVLHQIYNFRIPFFISVLPARVKLIHGRTTDYEQLATKLNDVTSHRIWHPKRKLVMYTTSSFKMAIKKRLPASILSRLKR